MAVTINGTTGIETNTDTGKIKVGASDDLTIEHSDTGNLSSITHSGAGKFDIVSTGDDLNIKSSENVVLMTNDTEIGVYVIKNGTVKLYHDNTEQCSTSANGLAFPSGKGIDFSATSDASGKSSELLDDYEEGTFTPTIGGWSGSGTGTYSAQTGAYTKVGRVVTAHIELDWTNLTSSSGVLAVQSLPFAMQSSPAWGGTGACLIKNVDLADGTTGYNVVLNYGSWSSSSALLYTSADNASWNGVPTDSSGSIRTTIVYITAS